jgi:antitoxin HigA-1
MIAVHSDRVTDILNGKRGISPETALRLARYFGTSTRFWLNLQTAYELTIATRDIGAKIEDEVRPAA